jgi:predicted RNase H-like nuclease (RuvC/YqgF family)
MDQETLAGKLNALERRLKLLLGEHQRVQQETLQLRQENMELKSVLRAKEEQLESFKNKINISKIVNSATTVDESESAELKQKLSDYIKKIDLCIAHMSE